VSTQRVVYTDGACSGNPGPGGWAWAVAPSGPFESGAEAQSTNQRMELQAVLSALRSLDGPLEVRSDSTYVVNCFRDRWWEGWLKRGWTNSQKKPVANRDLWEPLINEYRRRAGEVEFTWVKGHSSDPMNDVVDRLAVEASLTQRTRGGDTLPDEEDLGPADLPAGRDARLPGGRLVAAFGHRPPELGGYDENPVAARVRDQLAEILAAKRELYPDLWLLTGLLLGAEQLAAEAARKAGVPYVAVQPYPAPERQWPSSSQDRYAELIRHAGAAVLLERTAPDSKQKFGAALARRDAWLAKHADEGLVVWDGKDPGLGKLVRTLEEKLGDDVWIVDPSA
jgi:ribonuclease HI